MDVKLVVFDLDGTLADTIESITYCTNRALTQHGRPTFTDAEYKYFVGDGAVTLVQRALEAGGDKKQEYFDRVYQTYVEIFEKDCMYKVKPYDGIVELLSTLKENGIKTAVLSNKPHERTEEVIATMFPQTFDVVLGQSPQRKKKPSPDGVFAILDQLSLEKQNALYVGDTGTDMKTGKSAGLFTVGVLWGFREENELKEHGADAIIKEPKELMKYIGKEA